MDKKHPVDQDLEGAHACCAPAWIRHCDSWHIRFCKCTFRKKKKIANNTKDFLRFRRRSTEIRPNPGGGYSDLVPTGVCR